MTIEAEIAADNYVLKSASERVATHFVVEFMGYAEAKPVEWKWRVAYVLYAAFMLTCLYLVIR